MASIKAAARAEVPGLRCCADDGGVLAMWLSSRVVGALGWWALALRWRGASGFAWLVGLSVLGLAGPASGLQFEQVQTAASEVMLGGRGPIVKGDTGRLEKALAAVPPGQRLVALALDSPGGNVVEGEQLAHLIRSRALSVVIPANSKCVSACFLLFAASTRRLAASDALVGVHSASEDGEETGTSLAVTTLMARAAAELGIPPAIIGKMVQTTPGRVEWLTRADLVSMNVTVYDSDSHAPTTANTGAAPPAPAPAPAPNKSQPVAPGPGLAAGRDDRRVWEAWVGGLRGASHDGALFAVQQLGAPHPLSCLGPNGASLGDFSRGCQAARQRLAQVEAWLRANPDYRAGWNDAPAPAGTGAAVQGVYAAEYRGASFCGRQVARLTVKVLPPAGAGQQRALFSFGPQPTSPEVPVGAFLAEGSIDLRGGAMTLTPVEWVSQPAGYPWFGLSGRSDDGGLTFSGRVTGSSTCTSFTFRRVAEAGAAR